MIHREIARKKTIYLDACATTPPREEVIELISSLQRTNWGNSSSIHLQGLKSSEIIERSRFSISKIFNCLPEDLIFTSGATESIHLGIIGSARSMSSGRIVVSAVEHPAVISAAQILAKEGWDVAYWPVDSKGLIKLEFLDELLSKPTKIVSIIWAQPEVGTIQPIELISNECRKRNIIFHTDATQYISYFGLDLGLLNIDLLSCSAHKLQGPKGIGMLIKRTNSDFKLQYLQGGGSQEGTYRAGTQSTELIAGFNLALQLRQYSISQGGMFHSFDHKLISTYSCFLRQKLSEISGITFTGDLYKRLPNHISFLISDKFDRPILGNRMVRELSTQGIYVSSGTACQSGSNGASHVLMAMNIENSRCMSGLRLSLGAWLCEEEIRSVPKQVEIALRKFSNE